MLSDVESFVCHGAILSCWSASVTVCWGSGGAGGAARVRAFVIVRARSAGPLARGFFRASMRVLSSTSISAALTTASLSFSACRVGTAALPNSQCLRACADYSTVSDMTASHHPVPWLHQPPSIRRELVALRKAKIHGTVTGSCLYHEFSLRGDSTMAWRRSPAAACVSTSCLRW